MRHCGPSWRIFYHMTKQKVPSCSSCHVDYDGVLKNALLHLLTVVVNFQKVFKNFLIIDLIIILVVISIISFDKNYFFLHIYVIQICINPYLSNWGRYFFVCITNVDFIFFFFPFFKIWFTHWVLGLNFLVSERFYLKFEPFFGWRSLPQFN